MLNETNQPSCGILYVDDEEKALKYFQLAFGGSHPVFTAGSAAEGLALLEGEAADVGIVVSDQRMPEMIGAEFLALVRQRYPRKIRILTTAYSDVESAIQAVNQGHIYQYVTKPWTIPEFTMLLRRAADYHQVLTERDALLRAKMTILQRLIGGDRLRSLLLASRSLPAEEATAFQRALGSIVLALPGDLRPAPDAGEFIPPMESAANLLRREYEICIRLIEAFKLSAATAALENLRAALPGATLDLATPASPRLILPADTSAAADDHLRRLLAVVSGAEITEPSRLLFIAVAALAREGGRLTLAWGPEAADHLIIDPSLTPSAPADLIEALYEKYSGFDIARL